MSSYFVKHTFRRMRRDPLSFAILCLLGFIALLLYMMPSPAADEVSYGDVRSDSGRVHSRQRPPAGDSANLVIDMPKQEALSQPNSRAGLPVFREDRLGNFEPLVKERVGPKRPGDGGEKFFVEKEEDVDKNEIAAKKSEYGMNIVASEHIPMDRVVPDLRHPECPHWDYPTDLPSASVVIVFHNEGFTTLLRTVHSVLLRSPRRYLREVLLVDDFSDKEPLKAQLDDYIMDHFGAFKQKFVPDMSAEGMKGETLETRSGKVRVVRNSERSGLIRSRSRGAQEALGEVVVFLDAHCEVNYNWLVPLLAPIAYNNKTLTVPIIDGIDHDTFEYRPVYQNDQHFVGIWEWGMLYKEQRLDVKKHLENHRFSEPYPSPTHAGGLLAISRKFFFDLGGYDQGLLVWGGENFELSFKVWQCGGRLLWVPCSRVGHIYRPFMPYSFGSLASKRKGPLVLTNYKRVIEVWFDDKYKSYFYTREPLAIFYDSGDISQQLEMKERLQCKSFDWFIKNHANAVFKDFPPLPPNVHWGEVRSDARKNFCLDASGAHPPSRIMLSPCHGGGGNQLFRLNADGQLGLGERCIAGKTSGLKVDYCKLGTTNGPWSYDEETKQVLHSKKMCLAYRDNAVVLEHCERNPTPEQQWTWREIKPRL